MCLGDSNDVWQQIPKSLLKKYDVVEIDNDGWMVCQPRPDNAVVCCEITPDMVGDPEVGLYIIGKWGRDVKKPHPLTYTTLKCATLEILSVVVSQIRLMCGLSVVRYF